MLASMRRLDSGMAPTAAEIEQAREHVAAGAKAVADQRARLEQLRQGGHSTDDAEQLLATFEQSLRAMREHLAIEESFERQEPDATA